MDVLSGRLLCGDCGGVLGGFGVVYVEFCEELAEHFSGEFFEGFLTSDKVFVE